MADYIRTMRARIWRALQSATHQEIADGLAFYPGAHGLCRLFATLYPDVPTRHVAGIYAALSPLNTWDTNVANILDVLRDWSAASVNTTDINLHKALRIRCGENPEQVLVGRKVRAFYLAIADPDDIEPIPVDRHLINLALGIIPDKLTQSNLANNRELYTRIESVYADLGEREGIGNKIASIAWFVQRRIARTGQMPMLAADAVVCCGQLMSFHGRPNKKNPTRRFICRVCKKTTTGLPATPGLKVFKDQDGRWTVGYAAEGFSVNKDKHGRARVTLPLDHPLDNGGPQSLARFLVAESLGRRLRSDEHVHHLNGDLTDDRLENLALVSVEYHGRLHASGLFVGREENGRFRELDETDNVTVLDWNRNGAILGTQARHGNYERRNHQ